MSGAAGKRKRAPTPRGREWTDEETAVLLRAWRAVTKRKLPTGNRRMLILVPDVHNRYMHDIYELALTQWESNGHPCKSFDAFTSSDGKFGPAGGLDFCDPNFQPRPYVDVLTSMLAVKASYDAIRDYERESMDSSSGPMSWFDLPEQQRVWLLSMWDRIALAKECYAIMKDIVSDDFVVRPSTSVQASSSDDWTDVENEALARAWLQDSENLYTRADEQWYLWDTIHRRFVELLPATTRTSQATLMQWITVHRVVAKFAAIYTRLAGTNRSNTVDDQAIRELALHEYQNQTGSPIQFIGCWEILRHHPTFSGSTGLAQQRSTPMTRATPDRASGNEARPIRIARPRLENSSQGSGIDTRSDTGNTRESSSQPSRTRNRESATDEPTSTETDSRELIAAKRLKWDRQHAIEENRLQLDGELRRRELGIQERRLQLDSELRRRELDIRERELQWRMEDRANERAARLEMARMIAESIGTLAQILKPR